MDMTAKVFIFRKMENGKIEVLTCRLNGAIGGETVEACPLHDMVIM